MKKVVLCLCLLACMTLWCAANDEKSKPHPDLTGTWVRDNAKSSFGLLGNSPAAKSDETLLITQHEPEIRITRRRSLNGREETQELIYYTDGRGETNPSTLGRVGVKSKTKWDGAKLVSTSSLTRETPRGEPFTIDSTEKWQLSSDKGTLTQTNTITTPRGAQIVKQVFNRQP